MARAKHQIAIHSAASRGKSALLCATALQAGLALALAGPAASQPAPNARPTGGVVVGGAASISQSSTTTTITQSTQRAAVNWNSFNVGSNQSVNFQQPSSSAMTLNRVTGPDPSAIAGKITANGQIVLTNPSGIMFYKGAQVNAQALVASAPGISTADFMAGRMVFDQAPKPGAMVSNAGNITLRQAGLAVLVAPGVANSGTITAPMGHVILAGAEAHTVDLYGDGLVAIDVTRQVRTAPLGPDGKPVTALVTNTGLIVADGGTVTLTASAADGIVQNLVNAGGQIRTPTHGAQTGVIEVLGTGGSVVVTGQLAARGTQPGSVGGAVVVNATDNVNLAPTARINVSGQAGGGIAAIGTTLARARGGPSVGYAGAAAGTTVAAGARIKANAGASGNGGTVTVLSTTNTTMAGSIVAQGGTQQGNGGFVEISGNGGLQLLGTVDVSAPHGTLGTILIDPNNLTITTAGTNDGLLVTTDPNLGAGVPDTTTDVTITPGAIEALSGIVHLQATNNLVVASSLAMGGNSLLTLEAGNNLTVNTGVSITASQPVVLTAASSAIPGFNAGGVLSVQGNVTTTGLLTLGAQGGGIVLGGAISGAIITFNTTGAVTQPGGSVTTPELGGTVGSLALGQANQIGSPDFSVGLTATTGGVSITEAPGVSFQFNGPVKVGSGQTIAINADSILAGTTIPSNFVVPLPSITGGTVAFAPVTAGLPVDRLGTGAVPSPGTLGITNALRGQVVASTLLVGSAQAGPLNVGAAGDTITSPTATLGLFSGAGIGQGGILTVGTLVASGASIDLSNASNAIGTLGSIGASGAISIASAFDLTVTGPVASAGSDVTLSAPNGALTLAGPVSGGTVNLIGGFIDQTGGSIVAATLTALAYGTEAGSDITLTQTSNTITTLGTVASYSGAIQVVNGTAMQVTGPVIAFGGNVSLATVVGDLTLAGDVTAGNADGGFYTVNLVGQSGQVIQTSGSITAGLLTGSATTATLNSATNYIFDLGDFSTSIGGFSLTDTQPLLIAGLVSVPSGQTIALTDDSLMEPDGGQLIAPGGTVALAPLTPGLPIELYTSQPPTTGDLAVGPALQASITAGTLQLTTAGNITIGHTGDAIDLRPDVTTLSVTSGGTVSEGGTLAVNQLTGSAQLAVLPAANTIATLAAFHTANGFTLNDTSALTVTGPVIDDSNRIALTVAGDITLAGNLTAPAVVLNGSGAISQTAGVISTATLSGSAAGDASLLQSGNTIATLAGFTADGALMLGDSRGLTVTGPVNAANVNLITGGPLTLAGNLTTGGFNFTARGNVTQTGGTLSASTVSGAGAGLIQIGGQGGTAEITTLNTLVAAGNLSVADSTALTVQGPIAGGVVSLSAPGQITLAGGTFVLLGAGGLNTITVTPGKGGGGTLSQTGITGVTGADPTLRLQAPGAISLAQLFAPAVNLVLASDTGVLTGNIDTAGLQVLGITGQANLFGTVAGITGPAAAAISTISPVINTQYLLNGCIIALSTCGQPPPVPPPLPPPTVFLTANPGDSPTLILPIDFPNLPPALTPPSFAPLNVTMGRTFEDTDLLLPNISDRDY